MIYASICVCKCVCMQVGQGKSKSRDQCHAVTGHLLAQRQVSIPKATRFQVVGHVEGSRIRQVRQWKKIAPATNTLTGPNLHVKTTCALSFQLEMGWWGGGRVLREETGN